MNPISTNLLVSLLMILSDTSYAMILAFIITAVILSILILIGLKFDLFSKCATYCCASSSIEKKRTVRVQPAPLMITVHSNVNVS